MDLATSIQYKVGDAALLPLRSANLYRAQSSHCFVGWLLSKLFLTTRQITIWANRYASRRLMRTMRGYRYLKQLGGIGRLNALQHALTVTELESCKGRCSPLLFGAGIENAELAIRQYLLVRVTFPKLNKAVLQALGKSGTGVLHYIPPDWRAILRQHGFEVSDLLCSVAWYGFFAIRFGKGFINLTQIAWSSTMEVLRGPRSNFGKYVFFDAMAANNLPQPDIDGHSHDIFNWYAQWSGRVPQLDSLCHGIRDAPRKMANLTPVLGMRWPVPPLANAVSLVRFLGWGLMATGLAALDLLRGRWWHALMLGDAATAALVRMQSQEKLGQEYLFTQSRSCDRPLYTYQLEQRGAKITFYFYSTNSEPLARPAGHQTQLHTWQAMNWPHYLVWNNYQAQFVRQMAGESSANNVVGPIWFSTSAIEPPVLPQKTIAIFDVQPMRMLFYRLLAQEVDYFIPSICNQFLSDSFHCIRANGYSMAFKRKRQLNSKYHHPQYVRFVEKLSRWDDVVMIDPDTAAYKLIEKCSAVISMPFTSTAHIARELGKPTCFYDPTGMIQRDDRAAHGIPIIIGRDELHGWLASLELPTPTR